MPGKFVLPVEASGKAVAIMIEVTNLQKSFGDFLAVQGISFKIDQKSGITGLLGPNGAGKTTTMRLITGYLQPTAGDVTVNGLSLGSPDNVVEIKRQIGYLAETTPLYPEMLVSEYLEFCGRVRGLSDDELETGAREMIDKLELGSHLYSPIGILSKGFRQRVALAGTLIHKPKVIILDEPTSGLDPNQIKQIRDLIRELGKESLLILSTHILQEVEDICDRVVIINRGRIVADETLAKLQSSHSVMIVAKGQNILKDLKGADIVKDCRQEKSVDEFDRYICDLKENKPERLFSVVANKGWTVREFRPLSRSLEEIFRELTN